MFDQWGPMGAESMGESLGDLEADDWLGRSLMFPERGLIGPCESGLTRRFVSRSSRFLISRLSSTHDRLFRWSRTALPIVLPSSRTHGNIGRPGT
jgi:hypothetical protein